MALHDARIRLPHRRRAAAHRQRGLATAPDASATGSAHRKPTRPQRAVPLSLMLLWGRHYRRTCANDGIRCFPSKSALANALAFRPQVTPGTLTSTSGRSSPGWDDSTSCSPAARASCMPVMPCAAAVGQLLTVQAHGSRCHTPRPATGRSQTKRTLMSTFVAPECLQHIAQGLLHHGTPALSRHWGLGFLGCPGSSTTTPLHAPALQHGSQSMAQAGRAGGDRARVLRVHRIHHGSASPACTAQRRPGLTVGRSAAVQQRQRC